MNRRDKNRFSWIVGRKMDCWDNFLSLPGAMGQKMDLWDKMKNELLGQCLNPAGFRVELGVT